MKSLVATIATCLVLLVASAPALAQNDIPQGLGIGIESSQELGVMPFYTLNTWFQFGLGIGLKLQSNNNAFLLSPQGRFMFHILPIMYLFLDAQVRFIFQDPTVIGARARIGLMSMVLATMAVYGGISALDLEFDPNQITCVGLLSPFFGLQWTLPVKFHE